MEDMHLGEVGLNRLLYHVEYEFLVPVRFVWQHRAHPGLLPLHMEPNRRIKEGKYSSSHAAQGINLQIVSILRLKIKTTVAKR
jgi:hypothetical protein